MNEQDYYEKFVGKAKNLSSELKQKYRTKHNDYARQLDYLHDTGKITESESNEKYCNFINDLLKEMEAEPSPEPNVKSIPRELLNNLSKKYKDKCHEYETELNHQRNIGKISDQESIQKLTDFIHNTVKESKSEAKGAVPKKLPLEKSAKTDKKILPLDKEEKIIHKQLNNNKLNCTTCRKLINRLITERTRLEGKNEAVEHLKACHGIKIAFTQPKFIAPPTSDAELEWTNSNQNLSFQRVTTPAEEALGGNFPLLPSPRTTLEEIYSITPIETATHDSDNTEFVQPKNPLKRKASPPLEAIQTRNKFQMLTDSETDTPLREMEIENDENSSRHYTRKQAPPEKITGRKARNPTVNTTGNRKNKVKPPPPIIMQGCHGKNNYTRIQQQLNEVLTKGFTLKYSKNNIIINALDIEQYKSLKNQLMQDGTKEWHTYATTEEKSHAFVIKGLDNEPEVAEIMHELKENYNIEARKIFPMKTKYRMLYLVVTPAVVTLKELQNKIKYLDHVEITWELRRKFTELIQCKSCQRWGHSAAYCRRTPRCPNCGETHELTIEPCSKEPKCANCGNDHKATDTNCSTYTFRVGKLNEQKYNQNIRRQQHKDAPAPKENVWETRKNKQRQQSKKNTGYSSSDEESENEQASAFPRQRRPTIQQQRRSNEGNEEKVSELLELSREFKSLGSSLTEAVRFLRDFLLIFRKQKQEDRAFALLEIMAEINKYKF